MSVHNDCINAFLLVTYGDFKIWLKSLSVLVYIACFLFFFLDKANEPELLTGSIRIASPSLFRRMVAYRRRKKKKK